MEKNKKHSTRKKIIKYSLRVLLLLLFLLISISIALTLPVVQTKIAHYATEKLNKDYGTNIQIEEVAITIFGSVKLKKVLVLDHHKDTLIYSSRIKTNILDVKKMMDGKLLFGDLWLDNLNLNIVHYKNETETNLDKFVAAFDDGKPSSGKFLLTSKNAYITNGRLLMVDQNKPSPKEADFTKLNTHLQDFKIKGPNVTTFIKEMSFKDYRGAFVENLQANFSYTKKSIQLQKLKLKTKESFLRGDVALNYQRKDFSNFNNKVLFDIKIDSGVVATNDIRYFYDEMGKNQTFNLKSKLKGTLNDFYATDLYLVDSNNSIIVGDVNFKNLFPRSPGKFFMKGDFDKITSNYNNLVKLLPNVLGKKLPTSLQKLGQFHFTGKTEVTQKYIDADFVMNSDLGLVESNLYINDIDNIDKAKYKGTVILDNFNVGAITNQNDVGLVSLNIDVEGEGFKQKYLNTTFIGDIYKIRYNGYTYSKIIVDGKFKQPYFKGKVFVNDPNLYMDFDGLVDLGKREKNIDFNAQIDYANLKKLNFVNDSISVFKGNVSIKTTGNDLDTFKGDVTISDASYQNRKDLYFIDVLHLNSSFDEEGERNLTVVSPDIIDGKIKGKFKFAQLPKMVENSLGSLYANYKPNKVIKGQHLNFDFAIKSKFIEIFFPDITLSPNTNLKGNISSDSQDFKLDFTSPKIVAFENTFDNILLQIDNRNPLYKSYVQLDSIKTKYYKIRDFSLINTIVNDTLQFRTEFKGGKQGKDYYNLNLYHTIDKNNNNVVGFDKSEMMFKDYLWYLNEKEEETNRIVFDKKLKSFFFDNITVTHGDEIIKLNGDLSGKTSKNLKLNFENVNLNKVTPDVEKFKFDGKLNGIIDFKQEGQVYKPLSTISIDSLKVNDIALGKLNLDIKGDENLQRFYLKSRLDNENVKSFDADGFLEVVDNQTYLDVDLSFDKFNLGVLGKIGGDVIKNIRGFASGTARVNGNVNELDYNGRLFVEDAGMTIPYLGVDYQFDHKSIVDVTENKFIIRESTIKDTKFNTSGILSGYIKHKQFGDWQLDLSVEAERLLALNTQDHEDAAYFGKAFMKGIAYIKGPTDNLLIKVNAESEKGTDIKIPISDTEGAEDNGFITFVNGNDKKSDKNKNEKKYNGLELDFNFEINDNADIEVILNRDSGHGMRGKGFGTLLFRINTLGKFEMWGDFIAHSGTYNFKYGGVLDKKFNVKKGGTIVWTGDPMAAILNLEAVYDTKANPGVLLENPSFNKKVDVEVIIGIKGNLMNPEPDFSIDFPNIGTALKSELQYKLDDRDARQTQALYLLSTGGFLSQEGLNQNQLSNNLFEKASDVFNEIFHGENDKVSISPDFVMADRTAGLESSGRFGLTVSSTINERITINGKVGVPVGGVNESAIVGDVELQYRVNDDGSLRLRVFNKENDLTYIGQGVGYTQGLGISYEVDFDTFRELLMKVFKNKKLEEVIPKKADVEDSMLPENMKFSNTSKQNKSKKKSTENLNPNQEAVPEQD
ncbi:translocation/assembly module TamB domain-containing protein [Flavobacterium sp.]|uniref:translocation/assembly module TamB domain-containing protein n=1 Tax=Flavobacterium sp. TaxID=239 RepID=UPI0035B49A23